MLSQDSLSPNTITGLNDTLEEIERKFAGKRKENPITMEEAKRDVNDLDNNHNHNINNTEVKRRRILNESNISGINQTPHQTLLPLNLSNTFDQNKTFDFST